MLHGMQLQLSFSERPWYTPYSQMYEIDSSKSLHELNFFKRLHAVWKIHQYCLGRVVVFLRDSSESVASVNPFSEKM